MKKTIGITMLLLVLAVGAGWAADVKGTIKTIDATARVLTLDDGTQLSVAEGVSMEKLKEGAVIKASYEERDGKKIATAIEVEQ
jgi:Cu/Ag efflux protein CusF